MSADLELAAPAAAPRPAAGWRLSGRPAMYLLASLIVSLLAASAAPTPLYAIYQAHWGFTPITTTVVFGVYAVAVLVALLTLGRLSDYVGRRPVLLAALAVQAASLVVFVTASGVPELLAARVIQGLSTGTALGAIGAGMLDIDRERGTLANAAAPGMGTGTGALLSAVWALAGLYAALGPALVRSLTGSASEVLGGLSLTVLAATAVIAVLLLRDATAYAVMITGVVTLIAGVAITLLALTVKSPALFFAGTAVSGVGFGSGFQGGIRTVVPRAAAHERAGVLSLIFIVSYLGLGLPAVAAGYRIVHGGGLVGTARDYGAVLILLALLAVSGLLRTRARTSREEGASA
ncbi:MAG TPA: MFS transporter [Trebonia sp.]|nr:MFS transporter [Trebonia sp.]